MNVYEKIFFPLLLSLYGLCCLASPVKSQIFEFYKAYMENALANNNAANEQLCNKFFTKAMKTKIERMANAIDADPIIRAQDVNADGLESLKVDSVAPNWYIVSYSWDKNKPNELTKIPLKAMNENGVCKIVYIVPSVYGDEYGDHLIQSDKVPAIVSKDCSAEEFVRTFYLNYMKECSRIADDMSTKASLLRARYLTDEAQKEFANACSASENDGNIYYDLLLDDSDINAMAIKSLKVKSLGDNEFEVSYNLGKDITRSIKVGVLQQKGSFKINSFAVLDNSEN